MAIWFLAYSTRFNLNHISLSQFSDKSSNSARITCRVCLEDYQTTINFLSEPIDVYNDWVDACETANKNA